MHNIRLYLYRYLHYCRIPFKHFDPIASLKSRDFVQVHNDTLSFRCVSPSRFNFFSFMSNLSSRKTINCRITKLRNYVNIPIFLYFHYGSMVYCVYIDFYIYFYLKIKPAKIVVPTNFKYICFVFINKIELLRPLIIAFHKMYYDFYYYSTHVQCAYYEIVLT